MAVWITKLLWLSEASSHPNFFHVVRGNVDRLRPPATTHRFPTYGHRFPVSLRLGPRAWCLGILPMTINHTGRPPIKARKYLILQSFARFLGHGYQLRLTNTTLISPTWAFDPTVLLTNYAARVLGYGYQLRLTNTTLNSPPWALLSRSS